MQSKKCCAFSFGKKGYSILELFFAVIECRDNLLNLVWVRAFCPLNLETPCIFRHVNLGLLYVVSAFNF